ncbi:SAM-dependent methyltransferase [Paenibacillus provencensis]|uniref:SAM-dependent methyltransferase n=1 Tax=Paenibacillus provencensis TaxID=441151 RepID=A0ABW3PM72_9BACL|nr:SAM-dependent methyltransferase [Paenibacillus sp. MER 78]MCM3126686.1 methyltransferase domain-containing protein [Paenibacillus sp. MER 78]
MLTNQEQYAEAHSARFICTANHGFAPYAQEELRRVFGSVKSSVIVSSEVFLATLPREQAAVSELLMREPLIFLRHVFPVQFEENVEDLEASFSQLYRYLLGHSDLQEGTFALQVRKTEDSAWTETSGALKQHILAGIEGLHAEHAVQDADRVVSVYLTGDRLYAGISAPQDNLSDWNGGAVRFQKEEGQISRAKFKLLEAEKTLGIPFSSFHSALDIGAAPGGWTSFLLERGLHVTAVDPAKMNPSLLDHPNLNYISKNAGDVKFRDNEFDLLVCDMSWSPKLMARLVTGLLDSLQSGGTAVVTVKLMHKKPMALIREVIEVFEDSRMQVQRAKQLFHNRDEITLYMIKY